MKNRHILKLLFIIFLALVSTSTYGGKNENRIKFAEGNTAFCFDLYQYLKKTDENLFFSPYSISTALAITYAGAKGQTEDEIAKTMHFDFDREAFFSEIQDIQSRLNKKNISHWIDELLDGYYFTVKVCLPKFTATSEFELSEILTEMGMPGMFGDGADFSGIFGTKDFYINKIFHKAFIDINEEGTEAAAVTEAEFTLGGPVIKPRINKFYADHPFIFLMLDNKSRSILFVGRVLDPSD